MGIRVQVRGKTRWMRAPFGWLCATTVSVMAILGIAVDPSDAAWSAGALGSLLLSSFLHLVLAVVEARRVTTVGGTAIADRAGLVIGTRWLFQREDVRHAFVVDAATVRVLTKTRDFEIHCEQSAEVLLSAMRLASRESVGHFRLRRSPLSRFRSPWFVGPVMAGGLLLSTLPLFELHFRTFVVEGHRLAPLTFLYLAVVFGIALRRVRIAVGIDGVRWQESLFTYRFIPLSEIHEVRLAKDHLVLALRDGTTKRAHFHDAEPRFLDAYPMRDEAVNLVARIQARLDAVAERSTLRVAEIAHVRHDAAAYRSQALPADVFWRIVEDGSYATELRRDAIEALRIEPTNEPALRAITEALAEPDLSFSARSCGRTTSTP